MKFSAKGIKNVEESEFDKSDPFLIFYKYQNNKLEKVYKSEFVLNNLNPTFRRFTVRTNQLCDNIPTNPILVKCYDWEEEDECEYIGETIFSLEDIKKGKKEFTFKDENNANSGTLKLESYSIQKATFLDYILSGIELNLLIAVDYTKSNGNITKISSLHYFHE